MTSSLRIIILDFDGESGLANELQEIIRQYGESKTEFQIEIVPSALEVLGLNRSTAIAGFWPDLVFSVVGATQKTTLESIFSMTKQEFKRKPVIAVMTTNQPRDLFDVLTFGATDCLTTPLKATDILPRIWRLLKEMQPVEVLTRTLKEDIGLNQLLGESPVFVAEISKIPAISKCDVGVLIIGETGTGKEMCARAIHYFSRRNHKPFIPVNCGAIPLDLVENELFGHEKGAFTGALTSQLGLIHEANGGTLFLDEIDCLPPLAQVKLLRFLQEKEYRPLGSARVRHADVRIIAATNVDMANALETRKLRQDLYYRLNIVSLKLPPLRDRKDDIPLLVKYFLDKYSHDFDKGKLEISDAAMQVLLDHNWPGNVRQLEHVIAGIVATFEKSIIESSDILLPDKANTASDQSFRLAKSRVVAQFEKTYIQALLLAYHGNITRSAQAAQKNRRAFFQLLRKHHITFRQFKNTVNAPRMDKLLIQ